MKKENIIIRLRPLLLLISLLTLLSTLKWEWGLPFGLSPAWIAIVLCGFPIIYRAFKALIVDHIITAEILVSVALVASLIAGDEFDSGEVSVLMTIGDLIEDKLAKSATVQVSRLKSVIPSKCTVIREGRELFIDIAELRLNDEVTVNPGEVFPTDGTVVSGCSAADNSAFTGEAAAANITEGSAVYGGSLNLEGRVVMKPSVLPSDSRLSRLLDKASSTKSEKAPIENLADKWAKWLVAAGLAAGLLTLGINLIFGGSFSEAFERAIAVLVTVCPCAFVLATPLAVLCGTGKARKLGAIVRYGSAMESLSKTRVFSFDKTGTLTNGTPYVMSIEPEGGISEDGLLIMAASAEAASKHPIATGITSELNKRGLEAIEADSVAEIAGFGVSASIDGKAVLVGREDFLANHGVICHRHEIDNSLPPDALYACVAIDGEPCGHVVLCDVLRDDAVNSVKELQSDGRKVVILSGDRAEAVNALHPETLGVTAYSGLLPEEKRSRVTELRQQGGVCMIGDGINDAAAMAQADTSIAMSNAGSDKIPELADIVLTDNRLSVIPRLLRLSKRVMSTIRVSMLIAMLINITAATLAGTGKVNAVVGAIIHNSGGILVTLNSLLILVGKGARHSD